MEAQNFAPSQNRKILDFRGLAKKQKVLLTHGDSLGKVADTFKAVATSGPIIAAIANEKTKIFGVQFHPEVSPQICQPAQKSPPQS